MLLTGELPPILEDSEQAVMGKEWCMSWLISYEWLQQGGNSA